MLKCPVPLLKPFRALRYDTEKSGDLDLLVAPPYDVIDGEMRGRLLDAGPYNAVRLIRPNEPVEAARTLSEWRDSGILVREADSAIWIQEEQFVGPDGRARTRTSLIGRVQVEPYSSGTILPHERTFVGPKQTRLELLRRTRVKLSPILFIHPGDTAEPPCDRAPDVEAAFGHTRVRLWRIPDRGTTSALPLLSPSEMGTIDTRPRWTFTLKTAVQRRATSSASW